MTAPTDAATLAANAGMSWFGEAQALLQRISDTQAEAMDAVAQVCADTIAADGLVHLFGTGHSRIPVEEMFPRYGSFPGFHPIVELSMTFHTEVVGSNGQRQAMFIERVPGHVECNHPAYRCYHFHPTGKCFSKLVRVNHYKNNTKPVM